MTVKQKKARAQKARARLKSGRQDVAEAARKATEREAKIIHYNKESTRQLLGNPICVQVLRNLGA